MGDLLTLPVAPRQRLREVHSYGYAAGLVLVLMLDTDEGAHLPLRLAVVGPEPLGVETVAAGRLTCASAAVGRATGGGTSRSCVPGRTASSTTSVSSSSVRRCYPSAARGSR